KTILTAMRSDMLQTLMETAYGSMEPVKTAFQTALNEADNPAMVDTAIEHFKQELIRLGVDGTTWIKILEEFETKLWPEYAGKINKKVKEEKKKVEEQPQPPLPVEKIEQEQKEGMPEQEKKEK